MGRGCGAAVIIEASAGGGAHVLSCRVIDCTDDRGQLAGFMLAQLGADVVLLEPPGGSPARYRPPFAG